MKLIPLTQGKFAQVDDEDFEALSKFHWSCQKTKTPGRFYAYRQGVNEDTGKKRSFSMHRQIMGVKDRSVDVDHEDLDGLNNQRHNLRECTRTLNNANGRTPKDNKSGFKGVHFDLSRKLWTASAAGKAAGRFECKEDAARAYNKLAFDLWGEYARLNDVDPVFPTKEKSILGRRNTSGFYGVSISGNKWAAELGSNGVRHRLGNFNTPEEAARRLRCCRKNLQRIKN